MSPATSAETATAAASLRPAPYRVATKRVEVPGAVTLTLEPTQEALPPARAGQFNMLWMWGLGEAPISTSAIDSPEIQVHTIRNVGAVTRALCAAEPGDTVGVRGPFGRGWDIEGAKGHDVVIAAGGIGLAPLRPVIHAILANRAAFGTVVLVVGARAAKDLIFRAELDRWWRDRQIQVRTIVDHHAQDWRGNVGIITNELRRITIDPARTVAMVCGPEIMMRFVSANLIDQGVAPSNIAVSLERDMQCGVGHCGHCQLAGLFVCVDGPVVGWHIAQPLLEVREL
ncbi:MAG: FAD/NAD(P)-binding protein [Candidatus Nanopelagicales bacterium]